MPPMPYATWDRGVDLVAVERVLRGSLPHTVLEDDWKRYAARHYSGSAESVGAALGVADRTVTRWREETE